MTHKPPLPGQSVSPYPLKAERLAERGAARHDLTDKIAPPVNAAPIGVGPRVAIAAVIGSAAISAALRYWNRSKTT